MNDANNDPYTTSVSCPYDQFLASIQRSLDGRGLRSLRTFDLQEARIGGRECACPHHGTSACDCEMQVLMVYGDAAAPTTVMLHGNDGHTWISLVGDLAGPTDHSIAEAIKEAAHRSELRQGL